VALNYVTLILNVVDGSGSPASRGWASIAPSAQLTDATSNAEVIPPVTVQFAAAASPTVRLLATDNPTLQPPGWAWTITFQTMPGNPASYNFALPAGPQAFTATSAAPAVFTGSGAGYLNNTAVQLSGGSLPAGFTAGATYWVVGASGSTFQLAATVGGAPLASTSTGSGSVVATQSYLSTLSPVAPVTTMAGYLPLPSGTPAAGQAPLATGSGEASAWGNVAANPMTTSGDTLYGGASGAMTRLAGDTSNTRKFLREQSSAGVAQPPAWDTIAAGDVPVLNQNTTGTAANVTATLDQIPAPAAAVSLNSKKITSLANGTAASDAAAFGQLPVLSAADTSAVVGGTSTAPTVRTGTLDVIAAQHPAAADWSNNSHAITSVSNLAVSGLTGAASASRYVGATTSGAPASGTFAVGDYIIDQAGRQWICITAGTPGTWVGSVNSVTAADTSIVVGGTTAAPTIRTGTLDVIAAQHPAAADWSNNSHKITSLANGSGAQDAAAFGQTPAGGTTVTIGQGGTGQVTAAAAYNALSPMTTTGDIEYESGANTASRLAGNTSATKNFLTQTGTGSVSAAPAWGTIAAGDLPAVTTSTQGALQLDGTAGDIKPVGTAAAAGAAGKAADASHVHLGIFAGVFGTGTDGAATLDGTATVAWASKSGNTYTMTREAHLTSLTVNNTVTLKTANFRVFCAGTVTNAGTISNNGGNAAGSGAGTFPQGSASFPAGRNGGGGGTGVSGTGGNGVAGAMGNAGGNGGAGTSGAAGTGGTVTISLANARDNLLVTPWTALTGQGIFAFSTQTVLFGGGGGGGGSDASSNAGGGGGSGGGIVAIFAYALVNNGTISVFGGNGANGTAGNAGGGGGGAGGAILVYTLSAVSGSGSTSIVGGTHGNGSGTGSAGSDGGAGLLVTSVIQ